MMIMKQIDNFLPVSHRSPVNPAMQLHEQLLTRSTHNAPLAHVWLAQSQMSLKKISKQLVDITSVFTFLQFEVIDYDSRYSMLLVLTCLTEISSETKQACARIVVHTIHTGTTNETAYVVHKIVKVCRQKVIFDAKRISSFQSYSCRVCK